MEKLIRSSNAAMLFISLSLLIVLTTGCQEVKLKAAIESRKRRIEDLDKRLPTSKHCRKIRKA